MTEFKLSCYNPIYRNPLKHLQKGKAVNFPSPYDSREGTWKWCLSRLNALKSLNKQVIWISITFVNHSLLSSYKQFPIFAQKDLAGALNQNYRLTSEVSYGDGKTTRIEMKLNFYAWGSCRVLCDKILCCHDSWRSSSKVFPVIITSIYIRFIFYVADYVLIACLLLNRWILLTRLSQNDPHFVRHSKKTKQPVGLNEIDWWLVNFWERLCGEVYRINDV